MKMQISLALLLFFGSFLHNAQAQDNDLIRRADPFKVVNISGGFDKVILRAGNTEQVELKLSGIDASKIKTESKNGELNLEVRKGAPMRYEATLIVTYKQLKELNNSGSSGIELDGRLSSPAFTLNISGSGDFNGTLSVKNLEINSSGSADVKLIGDAENQIYNLSGSGDIMARSLRGAEAQVSISGSADVELNVDGDVRTSVSGSGRVINKG